MYTDQPELIPEWLKVHFFGSIFDYLVPRILKMQKKVSKCVKKALIDTNEFPSRKTIYVL